ncbi:MAG: hypothetical protein K2Y29_19460 [Beijerinckiaceae bacterium]|nr:hypothetical protein [Beijerinckiaceae bacterium]
MTTRPAVLRALTDLFCLRDAPVDEEIARYSELALQILPDAGPSTRLYVAAKLARHPMAPRDVLGRLAQIDPVCAGLLLEHARNFPIDTQVDMALSADRETAIALAGRAQLAPQVADALVARNDPHITKALVDNATAHVTMAAVETVKGHGRPDRALAPDLEAKAPRSTFPERFLDAQPAVRAQIIATARRAGLGQSAARVLRDEDLLYELRERAIERDWSGFSSAMARKTGLGAEAVGALVRDAGGEALALLLALLGASHGDAVRIFLCCEAPISHSYERVRELADVAADTPPTVAGALIFAMTGARPRISAHAGAKMRESERQAEGVRAAQAPLVRKPEAGAVQEPSKTPVLLRRLIR